MASMEKQTTHEEWTLYIGNLINERIKSNKKQLTLKNPSNKTRKRCKRKEIRSRNETRILKTFVQY